MEIKGEGSIFKSEIEKIAEKLHIGKSEDNSIHIAYNPQIYFNVPLLQSENVSEDKIKDIVKGTVSDIMSNPEKYGLYYNLTDKLQPEEFNNLAARAVVEASATAISDHGRIPDYAKGEEPQIEYKKSSDEQDEMAIHILRLKNIWWRRIPNKFKTFVAVGYVIVIIAISAIITFLVIKPFDVASAKKSEIIPKEDKTVLPVIKTGFQNGGFEEDLNHWEVVINQQPLSTSSDTTVTFSQGYLYNISTSTRRSGQKSLYIKNENTKAISNETGNKLIIKQLISGLKPNAQYRLTYYVKGSLNSQDSLWFKLSSTSWLPVYDGDRYYTDAKESYADWKPQESILNTRDWAEGYLWLINEDVCDLYLDDITFTEITKQQPSVSK